MDDDRTQAAGEASGATMALCLAEAAAARGVRHLEGLAEALATGCSELDAANLEALATRARAMLGIERLVAGRMADRVEVGSLLERLATLVLIAFPAVGSVTTSLACRFVSEPVARAVLASVHELAHVADAGAATGDGVDLFIASEVDDGRLVLALAARGACATPAAAGAGSVAFARAARLAARLQGEVVDGWRDGAMLIGMALEVGDASAA